MVQETIEQSFAVSEPARMRLSNIRGSTRVVRGEAGAIKVSATKHNGGDQDRTEIRIDQAADGTVIVETRYRKPDWLSLIQKPSRVDYLIEVPEHTILKVSGVSNSSTVEGIAGELDLDTVSGPLVLKDHIGAMKISTVSGDVTGERLSGGLDLDTVSGRVQLLESSIPGAKCSTVSGNISIEISSSENVEAGAYSFNSVSGNVSLFVDPETGWNIHNHTVSGRMSTNLNVGGAAHARGQGETRINDGKARVQFSSVSGNLWIGNKGEGQTGESPSGGEAAKSGAPIQAEAVQQTPSRSAMDILADVEKGNLSVEDALKKLNKQ